MSTIASARRRPRPSGSATSASPLAQMKRSPRPTAGLAVEARGVSRGSAAGVPKSRTSRGRPALGDRHPRDEVVDDRLRLRPGSREQHGERADEARRGAARFSPVPALLDLGAGGDVGVERAEHRLAVERRRPGPCRSTRRPSASAGFRFATRTIFLPTSALGCVASRRSRPPPDASRRRGRPGA